MKCAKLVDDCLHFIDWRQNGYTKVVRFRSLLEATAGYYTYAGLFEQLETVEGICCHIQGFGMFDRFLR